MKKTYVFIGKGKYPLFCMEILIFKREYAIMMKNVRYNVVAKERKDENYDRRIGKILV